MPKALCEKKADKWKSKGCEKKKDGVIMLTEDVCVEWTAAGVVKLQRREAHQQKELWKWRRTKARSSLTFLPRKWSPWAMTGLFTQRHKSCG